MIRVEEDTVIETDGPVIRFAEPEKGVTTLYAVGEEGLFFRGFSGIKTPVSEDLIIGAAFGVEQKTITFPSVMGGAMYDSVTGGNKLDSVLVDINSTITDTQVAGVGVLEFTNADGEKLQCYARADEGSTFDKFSDYNSPVIADQSISPEFIVEVETKVVTFAPSNAGAVYDDAIAGEKVDSIEVLVGTSLETYAVAGVGVLEFTAPNGDVQRYYARANEGSYFIKFLDYDTPIEHNTTISAVYDNATAKITFATSEFGGVYDAETGGSVVTELDVPTYSTISCSDEDGKGYITTTSPSGEETNLFLIPAEGAYYVNAGFDVIDVAGDVEVAPVFTNEMVTITLAGDSNGAIYDAIEGGAEVTSAEVVKGSVASDTTVAGIGMIKFVAGGEAQIFYAIANDGKSFVDFEDYDTPVEAAATFTAAFSDAEPMPPTPPEIKDDLDKYTMGELSALSNYLEYININSPETLETDEQYLNIKSLMEAGSVWFSNSNGAQSATFDDMSSFDETKCNADYKCSFSEDDAPNDYDQFMNLRVVGILHDYNEAGLKVGLTLQAIRSYPAIRKCGEAVEGQVFNWSKSSIQKTEWGPIDGTLTSCLPEGIKAYIKPVVKAYQSKRQKTANVKSKAAYVFPMAYSEVVAKNPDKTDYPWRNNNGTEFQPTNCEGYTYEYYKVLDVDGNSDNEQLAKLCLNNRDEQPTRATKAHSWLRTLFPEDDKPAAMMIIMNTGNPNAAKFSGNAGFVATFCV